LKILFTAVSVKQIPEDQLSLLIDSAKKYFLKDHQVNFVVFTDMSEHPRIQDVNFVKIDNSHSESLNYHQFQKVLSLNYCNLDNYDYIFVNDTDQMYINPVTDDDLISDQLVILNHFDSNCKTKSSLENFWSGVIRIEDPEIEHTMGNFFGGPKEIIKSFLNFSNEIYRKYKNNIFPRANFFTMYPEECLLIKFICDNDIKEKRLRPATSFEKAFMTNINACIQNILEIEEKDFEKVLSEAAAKFKENFKLVHNTKCAMKLCRKLFEITQ
jgi:hypothetical protein